MEKMLNEVRAIARENNVDLDRGFDMFRSNYEQGKETYKGTGEYDYAYTIEDETFGKLREEVLHFDRNRD
jgi:hypothetical protein